MGRAPCCDKASVKKGPWSPEEDAKLKAYIEEHGTGGNWIALPQKIGLKRCGKSCRLRWLNYLRPNLKHGAFSEEEDQIICSLYISIGSRWSIIAAQLPGRTDNDIKNYWNTRLKKKLLGKRRESMFQSRRLALNDGSSQEFNGINSDTPFSAQSLSASALERMQLHLELQGLHDPFSYNNPELWPKYCSLVEKTPIQSQEIMDAVPTTPVQQASDVTAVESVHHDAFTMEPETQSSRSASMLEEIDSAELGFHPSPDTAILRMENHDSNFNPFAAAGIYGEIYDMLYSKNTTFWLHEDHDQLIIHDLHRNKETINGEKESMNWWPGHGDVEEKSSSESWDSASALQTDPLLQDYVQKCDLYAANMLL